jgi:guanine deaminase
LPDTKHYLRMAIALARENVERGERPFASVIVKDGEVIATGVNSVAATSDPTSHAEIEAIRAATRTLKSERLDGCVVFASGHPCPMCLAAMYLAGISEGYYAHSIEDGAPYGLAASGKIYEQLRKPIGAQSMRLEHVPVAADGEPLYAYWQRRNSAGKS